jgi:hypothetical protein
MDIPETFQSMENSELVTELIHTTEHLQNCKIEGQIDTKQMNIQSILEQEILNRMESE